MSKNYGWLSGAVFLIGMGGCDLGTIPCGTPEVECRQDSNLKCISLTVVNGPGAPAQYDAIVGEYTKPRGLSGVQFVAKLNGQTVLIPPSGATGFTLRGYTSQKMLAEGASTFGGDFKGTVDITVTLLPK